MHHPDTVSENVKLSTSGKYGARLANGGMVLTFDLRIRGTANEQKALDINCILEAHYETDGETPSPEQMKAFAKANGILNVWPYWREYVQSATLRAGLPPLTLPLFRVIHDYGAAQEPSGPRKSKFSKGSK